MAFEEKVRTALVEWAEAPENSKLLDQVAGGREMFNALLDPNKPQLLSAVIDRTSNFGVPSEDGIKGDMVQMFKIGEESPNGLKDLITAYNQNPDDVAELFEDGKFTEIANIAAPENKKLASNIQPPQTTTENYANLLAEIEDGASQVIEESPSNEATLAAINVLSSVQDSMAGINNNKELAQNIENLATSLKDNDSFSADILNNYASTIMPEEAPSEIAMEENNTTPPLNSDQSMQTTYGLS